MIESSGQDVTTIWKHVKAVRAMYYQRKTVGSIVNDKCDGLLSEEEINLNIKHLSQLLKVLNVSKEIRMDPLKDIDSAGKIFVYLNHCPSFWIKFYHHILNNDPIQSII